MKRKSETIEIIFQFLWLEEISFHNEIKITVTTTQHPILNERQTREKNKKIMLDFTSILRDNHYQHVSTSRC